MQRQLIGAYFLHEYSFEASALFNPSIVPHPDQSGTPKGGLRFILSLRAVGEGHVSSLTFRSGVIAADGSVTVDPTARLATSPRIAHRSAGPIGDEVEVAFDAGEDISERVIFPVTESQSNGIEDARFVEFSDDGRKTYYATYTAYSGTRDPFGTDRDRRFPVVQDDAAARCRRAKQGHGVVSAQDRRQIRHDRATGQ